jgi:hypothetical protein
MAGTKSKIRTVPEFIIALAGIKNPMAREFYELLYLRRERMILDGTKFRTKFRRIPATPYKDGIKKTELRKLSTGSETTSKLESNGGWSRLRVWQPPHVFGGGLRILTGCLLSVPAFPPPKHTYRSTQPNIVTEAEEVCLCRGPGGIRAHEHRGFEALLLSMGAAIQRYRVEVFERATSLCGR